jgi:MarR family transcriptional regulator, lower aerobic nicotinate degradation pathway regulator
MRPAKRPRAASHTCEYVLEEQIGFLMRRAHQRHVAIFQRIMGESGITPTQFAAMSKLANGEEISQNQLGRLTAMDPATIMGVITRLVQRGLVERIPDPDDQRRVLIRLSDAGLEMMPDLFEKAKAITATTLRPLSRADATRLAALLDLLG